MGDRVIIERDGAVAHVKLNRPEKRNGLDLAMFQELTAAGTELAEDLDDAIEERLALAVKAPGASRIERSAPKRFELRW